MIPDGEWGAKYEAKLYDYHFNSDSIIIDLGCYVGNFANKISKKFNCKVHAFEPVKQFLSELEKKQNKNIITYNYGLGSKDTTENIVIYEAGTTLEKFVREFNPNASNYTANPPKVQIHIRNIIDVLDELNFPKIDLMKINIEGSEVEVLPLLMESEYINKIDYFQIQFHDFVDDAEQKYLKLKSDMSKTHDIYLDQPWKWTLFKSKKLK